MMPPKVACVLLATLAVCAFSHSLERFSGSMSSDTQRARLHLHKADMEHRMSLTAIASRMTLASALQVLRGKASAKPLLGLVSKALHGSHKRKAGSVLVSKNLRASSDAGYDGLDKARKMLNEMLEDTRKKYDDKQEECCAYDDMQSKLMELCRTDMATYDEASASARADVSEANKYIASDLQELPAEKEGLESHKRLCLLEIGELERQRKIVLADVDIMDTILNMTTCEDENLLLLSCVDECTGKSRVSFGNKSMQRAASQLQSSTIRRLLDTTLAEAYGNSSAHEGNTADTTTATPTVEAPKLPSPRNAIQSSPCSLPVGDGQPKCSPNASPNCQRMRDKFEGIKCGMQDKQVELEQRLAYKSAYCDSKTKHSTGIIIALEMDLKNWDKNLAAAIGRNSNAEEGSRKKSVEHGELNSDYEQTTKDCHSAYRVFENDWCALVKIRTELYKMKQPEEPVFFQDCEVSEWVPEECSEVCAGGHQKLTRGISAEPEGGAACPALAKERECNTHKCPIDCIVADWEGWSACNVHCGGGIMTRIRFVATHPVHGGEPCGDTSDSISCDVQACDVPCELSDWSDWDGCDKQCNGGLSMRRKSITVQAIGAGICAKRDEIPRLQERNCNMFVCTPRDPVLECEVALDLVLILDGSGSILEDGWAKTKESAKMFLEAFEPNKLTMVALILYSTTAEVKVHFTFDMVKANQIIDEMTWPGRMTYTSLALAKAQTEFMSGTRSAAQSVTVLITDGTPNLCWNTYWASVSLKQFVRSRLVVVAVKDRVPIMFMTWVASFPAQNNVLQVKEWDDMISLTFVNRLIADICLHVA